MDGTKRQQLEQHLAEAERHVVEGERLLEQQRALIDYRRREGLDVQLALELLGEMEYTQRLHVGERDQLLQELRAADRLP